MIHQYAMVDTNSLQVIGKHVSRLPPKKMANIEYQIEDLDTGKVLSEGKCFLSTAQKYWNVVKDPLYLVTGDQESKYVRTDLI